MSQVFIGENPRIEAVFEETASGMCAVITHPHSLMGGDMNNNVVMAAWDTVLSMGYSALRFNFRGVGRSGGSFDYGNGEVADIAAAVNYVDSPVILIGYSFGAWVAARYLQDVSLPAILISPPNSMFEFPPLRGFNVWSVTGSDDQFCNIPGLDDIMEHERITVMDGIDHFWFGGERQLKGYLQKKIELIRSISY